MKVAVTGHRPDKISDPEWVQQEIKKFLLQFKPSMLITGGAAGVDLWAAQQAYRLSIPFSVYRPWNNHSVPKEYKDDYDSALRFASHVVAVDDTFDYPGPWVYQKRNELMVNLSDMLLCVWDKTPGGTANTVNYARKEKAAIWQINPQAKTSAWQE